MGLKAKDAAIYTGVRQLAHVCCALFVQLHCQVFAILVFNVDYHGPNVVHDVEVVAIPWSILHLQQHKRPTFTQILVVQTTQQKAALTLQTYPLLCWLAKLAAGSR